MRRRRLSFTITEAEVQALKQFAADWDVSVAEVIRRSLRNDEYETPLGYLLSRARERAQGSSGS